MRQRIHVINASSRTDTGITADLARSLAWLEGPGLPEIACVTLADGPNGISTARDSDDAAPAVLRYVERVAADPQAAGFVVACFSDPGVYAARELTAKPVVGIGEAGYLAALALGDVIGTIGVSAATDKTARLARQLGIAGRVAVHRGLGLDYGQLQYPAVVTDALVAAGKQLRDEFAVQAIVFAGAGLAAYVAPLEDAVGLPVVDPTQAAVALVAGQVMQRSYR
ncbi:aspartate/glutamate racemase family protein [Devosia sp.]|uniref:aspartate/glutamate racemase family protein n=1 Tax=Devosia sp. TaxID=1871048 RepID=UPI002EDBD3C7